MKYVYHHLGLGDHIICNGLVRHFAKKFDKLSLFCKPHNYENVSYMYRDNKNIIVLPIGEDLDVIKYINKNNIDKNTIRVGFEKINDCGTKTFDECFYTSIGLPFDIRFNEFYLERNVELENNIFNTLNPNNEKYIFIHGSIDKNKIRKDLKIIPNPIEYKIFDLLTLIENAEEIHLMESSIKCLINSVQINKPKIFYHNYVRGYNWFLNSKGINEIKIID